MTQTEVAPTAPQPIDTAPTNLIERIMLESEVLELKARPDAPGRGIVVESKQSPEQGVVVTVLVTDGTLKVKDSIVCGESFSRVRAMIDDHGRQITEAPPSTPVTVFGLDRLPMPGDKLFAVEDAKKAREVVEDRQRRIREQSLAERSAVTLETLSAKLAEKNMQEIKLILKADAMGSLEPLRKCLDELKTAEVRVNLVHSALGGINETDVSLAEASGAVIVGFHTVADSSARQAAERPLADLGRQLAVGRQAHGHPHRVAQAVDHLQAAIGEARNDHVEAVGAEVDGSQRLVVGQIGRARIDHPPQILASSEACAECGMSSPVSMRV